MRPIILGVMILSVARVPSWQDSAVAAGPQTSPVATYRSRETIDIKRTHEVDLGEFRVSTPLPRQQSILTLYFQLHGTVAAADVEAMTSRLEARRLRLRQAVVLAARAVTEKELADPDLHGLRERIRVGANLALDGPELLGVGFHKIDYVAE